MRKLSNPWLHCLRSRPQAEFPPDLCHQRRQPFNQGTQAQTRNQMNLPQRLLTFLLRGILQTRREGLLNLGNVPQHANAKDEGELEAIEVGLIQSGKRLESGLIQLVQAQTRLLTRGRWREPAGTGQFPAEVRMRPDEGILFRKVRAVDNGAKDALHFSGTGKWPQGQGSLCHPCRAFIDTGENFHELHFIHGVDGARACMAKLESNRYGKR